MFQDSGLLAIAGVDRRRCIGFAALRMSSIHSVPWSVIDAEVYSASDIDLVSRVGK